MSLESQLAGKKVRVRVAGHIREGRIAHVEPREHPDQQDGDRIVEIHMEPDASGVRLGWRRRVSSNEIEIL